MQLARPISNVPAREAKIPETRDDGLLLHALPLAAAIVGLREGNLWVHDINEHFRKTLMEMNSEESELQIFKRHAAGPLGDFLHAYLQDPMNAQDESQATDGEGLNQRFFTFKLAPLDPAADGSPRCLVSLVDRTMEKRAERHLRAERLRDSLTGLPNRLSFAESIADLAEGEKTDYAVMVVDILRFSRINESIGSLAGDELLITFARRLMSTLRSGDLLARTGGNEFGLLIKARQGASDALRAAERIQAQLADPFKLSELEIRVDCGIGIALVDADSHAEELFRNAQFAVKQAKQQGRPNIYEPREASAARRRFSLETELRRALDRDELELAFQPLVDLRSGEVTGFEALSRWHHEDRGPINPCEFIPVAEESGLIIELGRWALCKAAETLSRWDKQAGQKLPLQVGVNMSAIQMARDNIAHTVQEALSCSGLGGDRMILELTESAIVQDPGRATRVFEALKGLEATVAMDDFGTGYSSLAYLQRLPIDVLKIDQSFVRAMHQDADSIAIVRAILSLADALGMKTTAEGIESLELATTLAALGCSTGQGFHFARALSPDDALAYWDNRRGKGLAG